MSSLKRLCLRRDSFSERICDDLSEVILQYLSLKDKLRLESVSKQFQRNIFQRHYEIKELKEFYYNLDVFGDKEEYEDKYKLKLTKNNVFDWISFETVLKKCPNIGYISLNRFYNKTIEVITRYCRTLVYFNYPMSRISVTAFEEFHRKFETTLKYFTRIESIEELNRLKYFPNTEELKFGCLKCNSDIIQTLSFPKLKKLNLYMTEENQHFFDELLKHFNCIKHLELSFFGIKSVSINQLLAEVSKLKHLIHLSVVTYYGFNNNLFSNSMKRIANNCPNLKSIKGLIDINRRLTSIKTEFKFLKSFKNLKRLDLYINFETSDENSDSSDLDSDEESNDLSFSFEAFNGLSNLTHLTLGINGSSDYNLILNENFYMTDIGLILPKLQYLDIHRIDFKVLIDTEYNELTQMADILSGLSKLETLKLPCHFDENLCSHLKDVLFKKCPKFRSISYL